MFLSNHNSHTFQHNPVHLYMTKNDKYFTFIFDFSKNQQNAHINQSTFSKYDNKPVIKEQSPSLICCHKHYFGTLFFIFYYLQNILIRRTEIVVYNFGWGYPFKVIVLQKFRNTFGYFGIEQG